MAECHYCGRRLPQLYKLTAEDIQREHLPPAAFQVACAECLDRMILASRVVPEDSFRQSVRNFSWMIPLFSSVLVLAAIAVSMAMVQGLGELGRSSQWVGTAASLVGTLMVWDRSKNRYAFTHDLRWSLNAKRVNLAVAILLAGIIVALLSTQLPR